jgi:group I intron endonuclease
MYIYKITNLVNNKVYIGLTKDTKTRWRLHRQTAFNVNHPEYNKVLYCAFRKYGLTNFSFEILLSDLTIEAAKQAEIQLILDYSSRSHQHGYNVTAGGDLCNTIPLVGEDAANAKLTNADASNIIRMRESELYTRLEVFSLYCDKIGKAGFSNIWLGSSWKHLQPSSITKTHGRRSTSASTAKKIIAQRESGQLKHIVRKSFSEVPTSTFNDIWRGYTFKELQPKTISRRLGNLPDAIVIAIRNSTATYRDIAKQYNISCASVSDIKNFKIYKNVT